MPISLPNPFLRVEIKMRNKSDYSLGALERLDVALGAISCPLNSGGEWEWVLATIEVVVWKEDTATVNRISKLGSRN